MDNQELKEQIELLIDLQEKERRISQLQSELDRLPAQEEQMQAGLTEIEKQLEEQKKALEFLRKAYRAREADVRNNQSRIAKREAQLRSVKTNQEYRAMLKEIDEIRAGNSAIEDQMLQCLDDMEAAENVISRLNTQYRQEKERIAEKRGELDAYARDCRSEQERLRAACEEIKPHVSAYMFQKYRFIQGHTGGGAVAGVKDAVCMGCYMNIPPQLYNELHRGDELKCCPHCQRILYVL
ncbi:MAG: C4-type zinc ribbon domain-containing protein [Desulfosalsimonadaceae bacterium]